MSEAVATLTADKVIDARGTACPGPLLEAKKGIGASQGWPDHRDQIERQGIAQGYRRLGRQRWAMSFSASSKPRATIACWCAARSSRLRETCAGACRPIEPAAIPLPDIRGMMAWRGAV